MLSFWVPRKGESILFFPGRRPWPNACSQPPCGLGVSLQPPLLYWPSIVITQTTLSWGGAEHSEVPVASWQLSASQFHLRRVCF